MNRTFSDGARRHFTESYQPLTNGMIAASIVLFLLEFFKVPVSAWLGASVPSAWTQPWRILTYPLLTYPQILTLLFSGYLFWSVAGSLERSWGTKTFAIFYCVISILTALSFTVASLLFANSAFVRELGLPVPGYLVLAALVVGFCTINPDETINFYGIIPIKTRYIAAGVCVVIFFTLGLANPLMGLFALVGCGFAVLWVKQDWAYQISRGNFPVSIPTPTIPKKPKLRLVDQKTRPRDDRFTPRDLNPFRWLAKRKERKKFERLMGDD